MFQKKKVVFGQELIFRETGWENVSGGEKKPKKTLTVLKEGWSLAWGSFSWKYEGQMSPEKITTLKREVVFSPGSI